MHHARAYYPNCPEALIVGLARTGDKGAFEELVRRRQSWIRNLMRRFCNDAVLADDLAQQVFLQSWRKIHTLKDANAFGAWLKRLAVTVWLQHVRKKDVLGDPGEVDEFKPTVPGNGTGLSMDLDRALAMLPAAARSCIVLSYHEGMTHAEIAEAMALPLGTVKSHIARGTQTLQSLLSDYGTGATREQPQ